MKYFFILLRNYINTHVEKILYIFKIWNATFNKALTAVYCWNFLTQINPITHGGGAIKTQVWFNALIDPEGFKIERSHFVTFPECVQRPR